MTNIKIEDMIKPSTVKEGNVYSYGIYNDRKPVYGLYMKCLNNTILMDIEIMAKGMFKLEKDPENYAHESRVETYLALNKFYETYGYEQTEEFIKRWVYKVVKRKMKDLAKKMKSNNYTYDNKENVFFINKIVNLDELKEKESEAYDNLECEISNIYKNREDASNEFVKWFNENKYSMLTKKQVDFINNDVEIKDSSNERKIRKKIYNKIIDNYGDYQQKDFKRINKENLCKKINIILDKIDTDEFEEFMCDINKKEDYTYSKIINYIYEELEFNSLKQFTSCINNGKFIANKKIKYEIINILNELLIKNSHI